MSAIDVGTGHKDNRHCNTCKCIELRLVPPLSFHVEPIHRRLPRTANGDRQLD